HLAVLRKDLPSPFLKETDEEKGATPKNNGPRPRIADPDDNLQRPDAKAAGEGEPKDNGKKDSLTIDFDGLGQRILSFPTPPGNFGNLQAGSAGQVFYLARPD